MSKSAIATLKKAEAIMATAGVTTDLVAFLNDGKARRGADGKKLWRNADKLALLIVDSAANAFQGENSLTLSNGDNFFKNMTQAVDAYISSNLDCWSQIELEDCRSFFKVDHMTRLAEMVSGNIAFEQRQADHDEALAMNAEFDQVKVRRCRDAVFFGSLDAFGRRVVVEAAHGEALEMDKQATHFRREQSALTERVNKIMGKDTVVDMNKARQKQQQTPLNLPKPQMIDVLRAALRKTGNATDEHIEAVADMSEASMKKALSGMLAKGARVTAYLTKSKSLGYGAITFGIDGQLPPGLYHAFRVGSMKEARNVAAQYGAMSWNF
jgi:hypothetical protein